MIPMTTRSSMSVKARGKLTLRSIGQLPGRAAPAIVIGRPGRWAKYNVSHPAYQLEYWKFQRFHVIHGSVRQFTARMNPDKTVKSHDAIRRYFMIKWPSGVQADPRYP